MEPIPAHIHIGGTLKAEDVEDFLYAIHADGPYLEQDESAAPTTLAELREALDDDGLLSLADNQANYGNFPAIEQFCLEHGLYYMKHADAKYEYEAEWSVLAPRMKEARSYTSDNNEALVVQADVAGKLAKKLERLHNNIGGRIRKNKPVDNAATLRCIRHVIDKLHDVTSMPDIPVLTLPEEPSGG